MQEMVIYGVSFDMVGKQPIVLLKTADSNKFLPIWIGHPEAAAILMKLQGATTPRPMTHDLLVDMLGELDVRCTQVAVTELRDNTFFASITLAVNGRELEIDSRPSDALALDVFRLLGCRGFARVDLMLEEGTDELYVLESNVIPGLTETSLLPQAAEAAGISFDELIGRIVDLALVPST